MKNILSHTSIGSSLSKRGLPCSTSSFFDRPLAIRIPNYNSIRHAHHAAQGRANGPKNGPGKRLGAKKAGDEYVVTGNIIFRQRGTKWFPGENVGMGRDHTIFALQPGYVKYYRNPALHPTRQYIGVTFEKAQTLPVPANAPRRRRLGMVAVPRKDFDSNVVIDVGSADSSVGEVESGMDDTSTKPTKREIQEAAKRKATGRLNPEELTLRPDYSYRESNWSIGRVAERAGVKVPKFRPGDRFTAWRKRNVRIARSAERRTVAGKKGKKDKPARGGGRGGRPSK